jgi:hypothetical protein
MLKLAGVFVSGIAYVLCFTAVTVCNGTDQALAVLLGAGFVIVGGAFAGFFLLEMVEAATAGSATRPMRAKASRLAALR